MPEDASPGHCIATFTTSITSFAIELGTYFDLQMSKKYGSNWFKLLEEAREDANPKYRAAHSCFDFSWIINEPIRNFNSPIRDLLPKNEYQLFNAMKDLLDYRNRWFHDYNPHNINELSKALDLVMYLATKCKLQLEDDLKPVIKRVREIKSGAYVPESSVPGSENTGTSGGEIEVQAIRQTAVGAAWLGALGRRKIQLSHSGSLIDLDAGKNVSSELTDYQTKKYLPLWKSLGLDWLWVDDLGSVASNVYGSLKMVGFWGQVDEAEQDPFAKFLLPTSYSIASGKLIDRNNQQELILHNTASTTYLAVSKAKELLDEFDVVRLTWDGDLIHFSDSGPVYLGQVSSKEWFAGHFLTPTLDVH